MSLSTLPSEILLNIFSRLSNGNLASVSLTSRVLREHANSVLWSLIDLEDRLCPDFFDENLAVDLPSSRASSMFFDNRRRYREVRHFEFWRVVSLGYVLDETWAKVRTLVLGPSVLWYGERETLNVVTEYYAHGMKVSKGNSEFRYHYTNGEFPTTLASLFEQGKLSGLREVRIRYEGDSTEAIYLGHGIGQRPSTQDELRITQVISAVASLTRAIGSFAAISPNPLCLKVETSNVSNVVELIETSPAAILSLRALKLVGTFSTQDRDTVNDLLARAVGLESLWYEPGLNLREGSFWDPVGGPLNRMIKLGTLRWAGQLPSEVTSWAAPLRLKRFSVQCYSEGDWEHLAVQPLSRVEVLRLHMPRLFPPVPIAFHDLRSLCVEIGGPTDNYCTVSPIITANPNLEHVHIAIPTLEASQVVRALAALENSKLKSLSIARPGGSTYHNRNQDEDLASDLVILAPASPHLELLRFPLGGKSKLTTAITETLLTWCRELDVMIVDIWEEQCQDLLFPTLRRPPPAECPFCSDVRMWFHNLKPYRLLQTSSGSVEGCDFKSGNRMNSFFMDIEGYRRQLRSE